MSNSDMIRKLASYYDDHPDDFADDLEAFDRLDCYYFLGNERRRPMAQLDDLFGYKSVAELLTLGGHSCNEDGGPFDWHCAYFYIGNDGIGSDGHLVSTNARDYRAKFLCDGINDFTVAKIIENAAHLHLSHGAQMIVDESEEKR